MALANNRVENKVALVTGGASGLGLGIAQKLISEGAKVVITDVNDELGESQANLMGCGFFCHDVSSEKHWSTVVDAIKKEYGKLHILVNNAAIEGEAVTTPETATLSDWQKIQQVNVEGVFLGCRSMIPLMRYSGGGCIINVSSIGSIEPTPNNMAYGASKAAVRHITKSVALYCAKDGSKIRCNSVHPGVIRTAMIDRLITGRVKDVSDTEAGLLAAYQAEIPQNEFQEIDDIANAVLFLASDEACHITGIKLIVDGGLTMEG